MGSIARDQFLRSYRAIAEAMAESAVRNQNDVGDMLRRGLAISTFNILENFVEQRIGELALRVNGGHLSFSDLPDKLAQRAVENVLVVAAKRAFRLDKAELLALGKEVGGSLSSVAGPLMVSPMTWLWTGSNMGHADLDDALRALHVSDVYASLRQITGRCGYSVKDANGKPIDLRDALKGVAEERHNSAHNSGHKVSVMVLSSNLSVVKRVALGFDALASRAALALRRADAGYLSDVKWTSPDRIVIRSVRERNRDFAEMLEGRSIAVTVKKGQDELIKLAASHCDDSNLLLVQSRSSEVDGWAYPAAD
ncbi:hypothetical protein [Microbacterium oleivorans]|uniref:Uncharacterized protein n=1 Tax=Microbacterium oleivorans TaxID=273677 RepID=A0A4R5YG18_9MICO|nr:hypothetical protein [Microbacterium oleivorans]TDL43953.1 hypothetical protein E2R54_12310 [Microbacterium oleivorans]